MGPRCAPRGTAFEDPKACATIKFPFRARQNTVTSNPKIPWKLVPGLGACLRADGVLLDATDGFFERMGMREATASWLDRLATPSRNALLAALQQPHDFKLSLALPGALGRCLLDHRGR